MNLGWRCGFHPGFIMHGAVRRFGGTGRKRFGINVGKLKRFVTLYIARLEEDHLAVPGDSMKLGDRRQQYHSSLVGMGCG